MLYVGSSNHAAWQIAAANEAAARRNFQGLVSEQSHYNLLTRHVELEVLPAAQHYGVGVIPWSPLAGGLLGGVLEKAEGGRRGDASMQKRVEKHRPALEQYEDFCREIGSPPGDVGLAWLLHQPAVTAPIVGPRTMEQLDSALPALDADPGRRPARAARRDLPGLQGRPYGVRLVSG